MQTSSAVLCDASGFVSPMLFPDSTSSDQVGLAVGGDMSATVTTLQGPIRLSDYLRTRCIEAVVHGQDFQPPVSPDSTAQQIAANALLTVLAPNPTDLAIARSLPQATFIDIATGRIARHQSYPTRCHSCAGPSSRTCRRDNAVSTADCLTSTRSTRTSGWHSSFGGRQTTSLNTRSGPSSVGLSRNHSRLTTNSRSNTANFCSPWRCSGLSYACGECHGRGS